jgi:adenylate cyclase
VIAELHSTEKLKIAGSTIFVADGRRAFASAEGTRALMERIEAEETTEVLVYGDKTRVPRDFLRHIKQQGLNASHIPAIYALRDFEFGTIRKNHNAIISRSRKHRTILVHVENGNRDELVFFLSGLVLFAHRDYTPDQAVATIDPSYPTDNIRAGLLGYQDYLSKEAGSTSRLLGEQPGNGHSAYAPESGETEVTARSSDHAQTPAPESPRDVAPPELEPAPSIYIAPAPEPALELKMPGEDDAGGAAAETPSAGDVVQAAPAPAPAPAAPAPLPVAAAAEAPKPKPAPKPPAVRSAADDFKASKITIKVKMLSIISAIIIGALSAMILLATYFFRNDSERSIQTSNLSLTQIMGQQIKSEVETISYKSHLMATTLEQPQTPAQKKLFVDLFFENNEHFIFVGIAERNGDTLRIRDSVSNEKFMKDNAVTQIDLDKITATNGQSFINAFGGATVVHNASPGFKMPILGFAVPLARGQSIVVAYLDPADFLKTFQQSFAGTTAYLVSDQGDVLAHPDSKMVLNRTNLADSEIIKKLLESQVDTGQIRFKDKDGFSLGAFKKLGIAGLGVVAVAQESIVFEPVFAIQRRNLMIMGIVVALAFIVVYFFSKTITVPIVSLVGATKQVESGDYSLGIKPRARDEIGLLTHSFVNMAVGLEEREKLKDAMGKFTNPEIAEMVLRGEMKLGGERKDAAIFFSDLRGFTAMSENMEPEEVVEFLNEYFTDMVKCVDDTGGVVDKFIGDAVMAHWGALFSRGNDTENAINAGIMMRNALIEFNKRTTSKSGKRKPIAMFGCGINTGPVISGQIGSETRLDYTVIGDTVNLASRVESLNKPFGTDVLITTDAYDRVRDIFNVVEMPAIKVKGKSEPQIIYAVLGRKDDPTAPKTLEEMRAMVGIKFDDAKASKMAEAASGEGEVKYEVVGDKKESH